MDMNQVLAAELNVKPWQVEAAVKLIDEGNTIPFISRYRKEATGSLNDEILRNLYDRLMYLRSLNDRKAVVLASIEEQGKLTAELKKSIEEAATLVVVEDLYRPYRPKRRTRATIAKEKGLEPLANIILLQMTKEPLEKEAEAFVSEEKEVKTAKDAIAGACDIIAESISDEADYRMEIRLQNRLCLRILFGDDFFLEITQDFFRRRLNFDVQEFFFLTAVQCQHTVSGNFRYRLGKLIVILVNGLCFLILCCRDD